MAKRMNFYELYEIVEDLSDKKETKEQATPLFRNFEDVLCDMSQKWNDLFDESEVKFTDGKIVIQAPEITLPAQEIAIETPQDLIDKIKNVEQ